MLDDDDSTGRNVPTNQAVTELPLEFVAHAIEELVIFLLTVVAVVVNDILETDPELVFGAFADMQVDVFTFVVCCSPFLGQFDKHFFGDVFSEFSDTTCHLCLFVKLLFFTHNCLLKRESKFLII